MILFSLNLNERNNYKEFSDMRKKFKEVENDIFDIYNV